MKTGEIDSFSNKNLLLLGSHSEFGVIVLSDISISPEIESILSCALLAFEIFLVQVAQMSRCFLDSSAETLREEHLTNVFAFSSQGNLNVEYWLSSLISNKLPEKLNLLGGSRR